MKLAGKFRYGYTLPHIGAVFLLYVSGYVFIRERHSNRFPAMIRTSDGSSVPVIWYASRMHPYIPASINRALVFIYRPEMWLDRKFTGKAVVVFPNSGVTWDSHQYPGGIMIPDGGTGI